MSKIQHSGFKTTKTGYTYDKWLFRVYAIIFSITTIYLIFSTPIEDRNTAYLVCDHPNCDNPFYTFQECRWDYKIIKSPECFPQYSWMHEQTLPQGTYGTPPSRKHELLFIVAIIGLIPLFFINHLLYNRGKKWDIEIEIKKDAVINFRELVEKNG